MTLFEKDKTEGVRIIKKSRAFIWKECNCSSYDILLSLISLLIYYNNKNGINAKKENSPGYLKLFYGPQKGCMLGEKLSLFPKDNKVVKLF